MKKRNKDEEPGRSQLGRRQDEGRFLKIFFPTQKNIWNRKIWQ